MADETATQSPDLQKTLADPEFLKLGPDDQVAVLKHLQSLPSLPANNLELSPRGITSEAQSPGGLPLPPKTGGESSTVGKLARGAALGAASGAGIPESTNPSDVLEGGAWNFVKGAARVPYAIAHDIATLPFNPDVMFPQTSATTDPETGEVKSKSELANMGVDVLRGIWGAGGEGWQGAKEHDPEKFAHGFGSAVTQALLLRSGTKGLLKGEPIKISEPRRLAKIAAAIDAGAEQFGDLKTAMPEIVATAGKAGMKDVHELGATVKQAHGQVEQEFNQALAPVAKKPYLPTEVSQAILNLETPDMAKTSDGRMQIKELKAAARDYQKPWTIEELNAKRMTENENLRTYYNKDTRAQSASPMQQAISKAVADTTRDIVYDQVSKANPGLDARALKAKQGALWALDDYLNNPKRGKIADLEADQARRSGQTRIENIRTGVSVGKTLVPHGYLSGMGEALFPHDPMASANAKVAASGEPSLMQRATAIGKRGVRAIPLEALLGKTPPRQGSLPAPPSASDEK